MLTTLLGLYLRELPIELQPHVIINTCPVPSYSHTQSCFRVVDLCLGICYSFGCASFHWSVFAMHCRQKYTDHSQYKCWKLCPMGGSQAFLAVVNVGSIVYPTSMYE